MKLIIVASRCCIQPSRKEKRFVHSVPKKHFMILFSANHHYIYPKENSYMLCAPILEYICLWIVGCGLALYLVLHLVTVLILFSTKSFFYRSYVFLSCVVLKVYFLSSDKCVSWYICRIVMVAMQHMNSRDPIAGWR